MMFPFQLTRLPNGVRVGSLDMPHMRSVSIGFWASVGGRHETRAETGISHFIEHLLFKGTERRSARQIIDQVEGVGGYVNAFTTEDHTCFYARSAARHFDGVCDVLGDMYQHPTMPEMEVERERDVIKEEILMYRDQPSQHAEELLAEAMWPRQALGRPLTGTIDSISKFDRAQLAAFHRKHYNGCSTVVTVAGPLAHVDVMDRLAPMLAALPKGRPPRSAAAQAPKQGRPEIALIPQETEQTHLAMGFHAFGREDERRYALKILSVMLGENMSSRLFQQLRERRGFCYSVQSSVATFQDTGVLDVCAGLDPKKLERAVRQIMVELRRFCDRAPTARELRKAQDYSVGQTCLGLESTSNQMMWMGESILGYDEILEPEAVEERLLEVTREEVQLAAQTCFTPENLAVAIVGPSAGQEEVATWLE